MRFNRLVSLSGVAAMIAIVAMAGGCKPSQGAAAGAGAMQRPPASVVTAMAVAQDVPVYIDQIGKTVSPNSVMIQPQVGGMITQVHFKDGQDVKKGQLLFTIDPRPFQAALSSAQASLQQAQANLNFAKTDYQRVLDLKGTGAVTVQDIDTKQNAVAVDEAQLSSAQAAVKTAQLNLEYCEIHSPIDGRAGARLVDPGNVVLTGGPNGGTNLLSIEAFNPIYVDFTVTEDELGTVRKFQAMTEANGEGASATAKGQLKVLVDVPPDVEELAKAMGEVPATQGAGSKTPGAGQSAIPQATTAPSLATGPGEAGQAGANASEQIVREKHELSPAATQPAPHPHEGLLTFVDNSVQQGTGTVRVRATVPNQDHYFWPGQLVHVKLVLTIKKNAVLVPKTAQEIGQQGPYVYVVEAHGTTTAPTGKQVPAYVARLQPVQLGQDQGDMIVITSGIKAGERVVTEGQMGVTPDGPVNPTAAPKTQVAEGSE